MRAQSSWFMRCQPRNAGFAFGALAMLAGCGIVEDKVSDQSEATSADSEPSEIDAAAFDVEKAEREIVEIVRTGDPVSDTSAFLTEIGKTRGHLIAFIELYRAGELEAAARHAKHPESEIYQGLLPAITARGLPGFAQALTALNDAMSAGADVEAAYAALQTAIAASLPDASIQETLLAVAGIVTTAAEEFAAGVDTEGAIVNDHEYQDAYGFLSAAREMLAELQTDDIAKAEAVSFAHEQLDIATSQTGSLIAKFCDGSAAEIESAGSRIEQAALRIF